MFERERNWKWEEVENFSKSWSNCQHRNESLGSCLTSVSECSIVLNSSFTQSSIYSCINTQFIEHVWAKTVLFYMFILKIYSITRITLEVIDIQKRNSCWAIWNFCWVQKYKQVYRLLYIPGIMLLLIFGYC